MYALRQPIKYTAGLLAGSALLVLSMNANAVPSFARQTGLACSVCHTVFPQLTAFGRMFKLNAYTMTGIKQVAATSTPAAAGLHIDEIPPLSVMLQVGATLPSKAAPGSTKGDIQFPEKLSLYYAGEINPRMGAFIQVTMDDPTSSFGFDMADIRHTFKPTTLGGNSLITGISLNNGPGMADLWNTTPAWTYPYLSSNTTLTPAADPAINMMVMMSGVAGLSAYGLYDNHWYANLGAYHATSTSTGGGSIANLAPYWRFAWQGTVGADGYLEVGTYGIVAKVRRGWMKMGTIGMTDRYADTAFGAQYEKPLGDNELDLHAIYIHEKQTLDSTHAAGKASNRDNTLKQLRMDAAYIVGGHYQYTLGYFKTTGTTDVLRYKTSLTGSPDSSGWIAEMDYLPWQNTKFSLQYTGYSKFDGGSNYLQNSVQRSASDNNSLLVNAWFMW